MITCYIFLTLIFYCLLLLTGFFLFSRVVIYYGQILESTDQRSFSEICLLLLKKTHSFLFSWEIRHKAELEPEKRQEINTTIDSLNKISSKYLEQLEQINQKRE